MSMTPLSQLPFRYARSIQQAAKQGNGWNFTLCDDHGTTFMLTVTAFDKNIVQIRLFEDSFHPTMDDSVRPDYQPSPFSTQMVETDSGYTLSTEGYRIEIGKSPYSFRLFSPTGQLLLEEKLNDVDAVGEGEQRVPPLGFSYKEKGQTACANIGYALGVYDELYGLGERFTEYNKRGQLVVMRNSDALGVRTNQAYKNIPFYLSTAGYGLFANSTSQIEFHLGTRSAESINLHVPGNQAEFYLFTGTPEEIVSCYTCLTGPAVLPPDWSFGVWYSNSFKASSQAEVEADARTLKEKNLPVSVIHLDCYWLRDDHWCDFVWDETTYPTYMDMIATLKNNGYRLCVWVNPYVTIITDMYREGDAKGYFVKDKNGATYTADLWHGLLSPCAIVDFTNPEATGWYQGKVQELLNQGIDAIKTDFGENIPEDSVFYNGLSGFEMRNLYSRLYNQAVAAVCRQQKGDDYLLWGRSGCAGMQQYPVCWSGDPHSSYNGMASVLKSGLSIGISGVPFWSHDIGGFFGLDDEQLMVRWAQFGLLSSHSRFHGTTTRQPWAFGPRAEKIIGDFMRLRYRFMPYILATARSCASRGLPFLRPMYLACPGTPGASAIWDQYLIGDDLLVAPVFGPDNTSRRVYLPEGEWTHCFTHQTHQGNQYIETTSPLEEIPLFVRTGGQLNVE